MSRRLKVALDHPKPSHISVISQLTENVEADLVSVEKWSEAAIERMFRAADEALGEKREDQEG